MLLRNLLLAVACCVVIPVARSAPPDIDNLPEKIWEVRYDVHDHLPHFPYTWRTPSIGAIRLHIVREGNGYFATLYVFKVAGGMTPSYQFIGQARGPLSVEGTHAGRQRIGFWSGPLPFTGPGGPAMDPVFIKGFWQPGIDVTQRAAQRLVVKFCGLPGSQEPTKPGGDEPGMCVAYLDGDVLEETMTPPNPIDPPPYGP